MRHLIPNAFTNTKPNDNIAASMVWKRPIMFIEAPGTTANDLFLHWHRRSMRDPNYAGFLDLLLNVRGVDSTAWNSNQASPDTVVKYESPHLVEGDVAIRIKSDTIANAFNERIEFANFLFENSRSTYIRYYTESTHPDLQEKQDQLEDYFCRQARLIFVEKNFDTIFQLARMIREPLADDVDYEITQDQLDWYVASVKRYNALKERWRKKSAMLSVEDYSKRKVEITWPDKVLVHLNLPHDELSMSASFPFRLYRAPTNFKEADAYLKEKLAS
jgi:hypothetical protein